MTTWPKRILAAVGMPSIFARKDLQGYGLPKLLLSRHPVALSAAALGCWCTAAIPHLLRSVSEEQCLPGRISVPEHRKAFQVGFKLGESEGLMARPPGDPGEFKQSAVREGSMPEYAEDTARLVEASSVIVRATVSQRGASNEPTVPASPRLVIAQINSVFRAGPTLGNLVGRTVTIELDTDHGLDVGHQAIFFTNGLVYGDQIVLREVGHRHVNAQNEREVGAAVEALPLRHLRSRLESADIVVVGTVEHVQPSGIREPISFHSPKWMLARVRVRSLIKGEHKGNHIEVLFPSARDVLWAGAHRFREHEEGIFLLHRGAAKWGAPQEPLSALDPADFQHADALPQIQQLLRHDQ